MYNLCKLLKDWENYGHSNMRSRNFHNYRLLIVQKFESGNPDFPNKETVVKFCNKWVKDMAQHPSECMSDYLLFDEDNNELVKCYKSRSKPFTVTEVFPEDYSLIKIDDECMVNEDHQIIQFQDGKTFYLNAIDSDELSFELKRPYMSISGVVLDYVWSGSYKVWIKL